MQRITIGRYRQSDGITEPASAYAGWIEGVRDDGSEWILYLDTEGSPQEFWGQRDADGAVRGESVDLSST